MNGKRTPGRSLEGNYKFILFSFIMIENSFLLHHLDRK